MDGGVTSAAVVAEAPRSSTSAPRSGPVLRFAGVGKTYDDGTVAVSDVSLTVAAGEIVSIVGPSGCGKSTLLRVASGLMAPSEGRVERDAPEIGFVFQDPTLLPWRSVRRNVELLCELRGMARGERTRRAAEMIELVGLGGFERYRPRALSGGMRMRVSLARSLATHPELFLFDEPFAALDEITRERLNDQLLDIFVRERFGALFITHAVTEAVYLAGTVLVMSSRPGTLVGRVQVPFPYPRSAELRFDPAFVAVVQEVAHALRTGTP